MIGITAPIVKHSIAMSAPTTSPRRSPTPAPRHAGRPGPVLIDVPVDSRPPRGRRAAEPRAARLPAALQAQRRQVRIAARALAAARRPVLYAGGGVVHAGRIRGADALAGGRAARDDDVDGVRRVPGERPPWLGMLGMHGTRAANWAMDEADLIVAVGARFDDRVTGALDEFAPRAKVVHIDVDPAEIGKNVAAHVPIVGDAGARSAAIAERVRRRRPGAARRLVGAHRRLARGRAPNEPRPTTAPEAALDALQEAWAARRS